jgi:hypothetical protein
MVSDHILWKLLHYIGPCGQQRSSNRIQPHFRSKIFLLYLNTMILMFLVSLCLESQGGGHWALVLEIYVSPKIGIFKKNGTKN